MQTREILSLRRLLFGFHIYANDQVGSGMAGTARKQQSWQAVWGCGGGIWSIHWRETKNINNTEEKLIL